MDEVRSFFPIEKRNFINCGNFLVLACMCFSEAITISSFVGLVNEVTRANQNSELLTLSAASSRFYHFFNR